MSLENDLDTAINNLEEKLANHESKLPNRCDTTLYSNYHPSEETTVELDANGVQYFKDIIVVLRWEVELGRVKLFLELDLLYTHLALPREGHLQQVYHIFGYLKKSPRPRVFMDLDHPNIDESRSKKLSWVDFYIDAEESIPPYMAEPKL